MSETVSVPVWVVCLATFAAALVYCRQRQVAGALRRRLDLFHEEWMVDKRQEQFIE